MAQPLSIENKSWVYLITTRTASSRLWFVNDKALESKILGALARYQDKYKVEIFAFIIMGNHYHLLARFPSCNRALFMRDFNSAVARLVGRYVKAHGRRSVWARRYSYQVLLREEDIKHWFYYVALNPISSRLVKSIDQYPSYNSVTATITGRKSNYKWINWSKYIERSRYDRSVTPEDFAHEYELILSRLPHFESLDIETYVQALAQELKKHQDELLEKMKLENSGFLGPAKILQQKQGSFPSSTKSSHRYSFRPLILTLCNFTKRYFLKYYFALYDAFKLASEAFRAGNMSTKFPDGTYMPPRLVPITAD